MCQCQGTSRVFAACCLEEPEPSPVGIAISGRAGSGKSTLAAALCDHGFVRVAFADALKDDVFRLYGLTKLDPGGREKLIEHGDGERAKNPRVWIDRLAERVRWARVCGLRVVIDDLRFPAEAEWCRSNGFLLVRVEAPAWHRADRLAAQGLDPAFASSTTPGEREIERDPPRWDAAVWNADGGAPIAAAERLAALARRRTPG